MVLCYWPWVSLYNCTPALGIGTYRYRHWNNKSSKPDLIDITTIKESICTRLTGLETLGKSNAESLKAHAAEAKPTNYQSYQLLVTM